MKKKFFLFILSNTIALLIFAQPYAFSIYESGIAVNHSEDNFKNLFNNWNSDFISYSKSLDLLSYSYVGEVKSKSQINDIAEQCTKEEYVVNTLVVLQNKVSSFVHCSAISLI